MRRTAAALSMLLCLGQETLETQRVLGLHYGPLANLMAAYGRESNTQAKYVDFAKKADQDGFAGAASLFRAVAWAEGIHARNHADAIKRWGGTPKAENQSWALGDTRQNLTAALEGEQYERDRMYPAFVSEARAAGNVYAIRTLEMAASAEGDHADLYAAALREPASWTDAKTFHVCPVCGKTVAVLAFEKCPVCRTEKARFAQVR